MSDLDISTLFALDALQSRYITAVDQQRMDSWLDTFSQDDTASYICNTAENVEAGLKIALILDDCRARLQDRVTFVTKIWAGTYSAHRTRHIAQRTAWRRLDEDCLYTESNFIVTYSSADVKQTEVFATGVYRDTVRTDKGGELKFLRKEVIIDTHILHRYLVFPL